jgi:hypothetical protein
MNLRAQDPTRTLERLLANGLLTGWPRRPEDQALLVRLTAARFEPGREYREPEVNDVVRDWVATFSAEHGIDHVTMRRALVDSRLLVRDRAGGLYRVDEAKRAQLEPLRAIQPAAILRQVQEQRAARKREHRDAG